MAEAAHDPARLPDLAHKVARQTVGMVLPCVIGVVLGVFAIAGVITRFALPALLAPGHFRRRAFAPATTTT